MLVRVEAAHVVLCVLGGYGCRKKLVKFCFLINN